MAKTTRTIANERETLVMEAVELGGWHSDMHEALKRSRYSHDNMSLSKLLELLLTEKDRTARKVVTSRNGEKRTVRAFASRPELKKRFKGWLTRSKDRLNETTGKYQYYYTLTEAGKAALDASPWHFQERWRSSSVMDLARAMWQEQLWEWPRGSILADALMDAGCDNEEVLRTLKEDRPLPVEAELIQLVAGRILREKIARYTWSFGDVTAPDSTSEDWRGQYVSLWISAECERQIHDLTMHTFVSRAGAFVSRAGAREHEPVESYLKRVETVRGWLQPYAKGQLGMELPKYVPWPYELEPRRPVPMVYESPITHITS